MDLNSQLELGLTDSLGLYNSKDTNKLFYIYRDGKITIRIVYVDDIILTGNDIVKMKRLKEILATEFNIKDLGSLRYFLGMEVARNNTSMSVSQRK